MIDSIFETFVKALILTDIIGLIIIQFHKPQYQELINEVCKN